MDYQKFITELPDLFHNWGTEQVTPKADIFSNACQQVKALTTANVMQLLNFAVECLDENEVYCEIGCFHGSTMIGALLGHPLVRAYGVDNFSENINQSDDFEQLISNLSKFGLSEQLIFCNQNFEEFFADFRATKTDDKIGVYFYDGSHDYRSQLMGLLLVKPFLADQAVIIVDDSNWAQVQQANWDFIASTPQANLLLELLKPKNYKDPFWNGLHVISWNSNQTYNYDWDVIHRAREEAVIKKYYQIPDQFYQERSQRLKELSITAPFFLQCDQLQTAEPLYLEILEWQKNNPDAYRGLGVIYYRSQRYFEALTMFNRALEIQPQATDHYNLGTVYEKLGEIDQAIKHYDRSITLDSTLVDSYNNIANLFQQAGRIEDAELIYKQAIRANPNHFGAYLNLGNLDIHLSRVDSAISNYRTALSLQPKNIDILYNLGLALQSKSDPEAQLYFGYAQYYQGNYEQAIAHMSQVSDKSPSLYLILGECYSNIGDHELALQTYQGAVQEHPAADGLYYQWGKALQNLGRNEEAIAVFAQGNQHLYLRAQELLYTPILYDNQAEIEYYRNRFTQGLSQLTQETSLSDPEKALKVIQLRTNFYLQYQGKNDVDLQKQYGDYIQNIINSIYPQWVKPLPIPPVERKIRVGYISQWMSSHTVGMLFRDWVRYHNRADFEVYCYHIGAYNDQNTQYFKIHSDHFYQITEYGAIAEQVLSDQLHILVYLDLGMSVQANLLAALRLAPIQAVTWGHAITSGQPHIDYYFSGESMEPPNGSEHYSETLINTPGIGVYYQKPQLPTNPKTRAEFGIREEAIAYLYCQSIYKYLPQNDYIFAEIAKGVPDSQLIFIEHYSPAITQKFRNRLVKVFNEAKLDINKHCLIVPRQNQDGYMSLNLAGDIFLDTLTWSGSKTTLEAIACNLPVVTYPGEFMRGRHSYGILKMMGVTDTIASSESNYLEIAIKLGLDHDYRKYISEKIKYQQALLWEDKRSIIGLEQFYKMTVNGG